MLQLISVHKSSAVIQLQERLRDALRFLWRDNVEHPIEDYIMNVHLFGKKDLPCCNQWALKQAVLEKGYKYPQSVSDAILEHFYVVDYLDSFVSEQEE